MSVCFLFHAMETMFLAAVVKPMHLSVQEADVSKLNLTVKIRKDQATARNVIKGYLRLSR